MANGFRPNKKFRITYANESTEIKHLPTKTMIYAIHRKLIKYSSVFCHPRPLRIVSVEEVDV